MYRRGYGIGSMAMMGLIAAASMASMGGSVGASSEGTQAANARAASLDAAKVSPKAQINVDIGQRYMPWFAPERRLPRSKNPPTQKKRGKTNRRKAQLKAKRRRARR